jgi:hypothetical protein
MKTFAALLLVFALIYLALPPQVRLVTYSFDRTTVQFWLPTFVETPNGVSFVEYVAFDKDDSDRDWTYDRLRGVQLLCGREFCSSAKNSLPMIWRQLLDQIDRLNSLTESLVGKLNVSVERVTRARQFLEVNECGQVKEGPRRPDYACAIDEAQQVGKTICQIRELGSKFCEESKAYLTGEMPKVVKEAIAREGCGAVASAIIGEPFNAGEKTVRKYTEDLIPTLISEGLGEIHPWLKKAFDYAFAIVKTDVCLPQGIALCREKYEVWNLARETHFQKQGPVIAQCNEQALILEKATSESDLLREQIREFAAKVDELKTVKLKVETKREIIQFSSLLDR